VTAAWGQASIVGGLRALGVRPGQDLLVHSSLRQVGPVQGGVETVLRALREAAGPTATIVVPAFTEINSRSSRPFHAATAGMTATQLAQYVAAMPGFDPLTTPSYRMGLLAEYVRRQPDAARSAHPQCSFAAIGPRARQCTEGHALTCHHGEHSPLGWLYRAGASVLLLGVGYASCSAFHLAEYRLPGERPRRRYECFIMEDGVRRHRAFIDVDLIDSDFKAIGADIDKEPFVRHGLVGTAYSRLLPVRDAVDFALSWRPFRIRRAAYG
jgi:aminoglycoside 3-N-acetyltransferase